MKKLSVALFLSSAACVYDAHAQEAMLLFGGESNRTFLGCLNCGEYDNTSIHNKYGEFGSEYAEKSIFNKYGNYGSPYSSYSACNEHTNRAPVIVDKNGKFYGRLSVNRHAPDVVKNDSIRAWLAAVCKD